MLFPLLVSSKKWKKRRVSEGKTPQGSINRLLRLCKPSKRKASPSISRTQANLIAIQALLAESFLIYGGAPRDLAGQYDEEIRDIDLAIASEENVDDQAQRVIQVLQARAFSWSCSKSKGAHCLEMYFTWKDGVKGKYYMTYFGNYFLMSDCHDLY